MIYHSVRLVSIKQTKFLSEDKQNLNESSYIVTAQPAFYREKNAMKQSKNIVYYHLTCQTSDPAVHNA